MREFVLALLMTPLAMAVSIKTFWGINCSGPFEELPLDGNIGDGTYGLCTRSQDATHSSVMVYDLPSNPDYHLAVSGYERNSEYDCAVETATTSLGNSCYQSLSADNFQVSLTSFGCQGPKCGGGRGSDGLPGYLDSKNGYVYLYDGLTKHPEDLGGLTHREFAFKHGRKVPVSEYFK